ncbi:hypothetical protein EJB05_26239 [Eragrostis curvula]|uniref:Hydrophobic seed protein domain-containing protein n=1 Tax=Eragrostis curvula TaxID=38414 RepID=A0A5J9UKC2_9POAL|nr:hypothetical protein EJB05_26239 [Eragrostis curvula]
MAASTFGSAACKVILVAAITIALLFSAGSLIKPNCPTWCVKIGFPKGGHIDNDFCCCNQ